MSRAERAEVLEATDGKRPRQRGARRCRCGSRNCAWQTDPYVHDIYGSKTWSFLCADCVNAAVADI